MSVIKARYKVKDGAVYKEYALATTIEQVDGLSTALVNLADDINTHTHAYNTLTGIPSTFTPAAHTHGAITNAGKIGSDTAVASGHKLVTTDGNGGVRRSGIAFGTTASQYLRNNGVWGAPDWSHIDSKPVTATRWPTWSEVTGKPSLAPEDHNHDDDYLKKSGDTATGKIVFSNATTHGGTINLPRLGTATPANTVPGDFWYRSNNLYYNNEGTIRAVAHTGSWGAMSVAEGQTGTATSSRFMRADNLKAIINHHALPADWLPSIPTKAEAEAGTINNKYMTPLRTKEAIENIVGDIDLDFDISTEYARGVLDDRDNGQRKIWTGNEAQFASVTPDVDTIYFVDGPEIAGIDWINVNNRPTTFPPSQHIHNTIVETRDNAELSFWLGTEPEYQALSSYGNNTIYLIKEE